MAVVVLKQTSCGAHDRHTVPLCREENILHTARSTPNTAFLHDVFGNVTNATDTAGNSWRFTYSANSTLTNEVFTSPRLCDSARQTNTLARLLDAYSRPVGYDLAIGDTPCSRVRYGYDAEGRIATLAATNAANCGFQVAYLNESGYNYGYTLTTPNGATLTRTVTRDPYRRSLTLDCTTRFNNVVFASFAYTFDAHSRPVARNNDRFAYNGRDEITSALIGTNRINRAYDTIGNHVFCSYNAATNFYANNQLNQTTASYVCAPSVGSADNDAPPQFDGYDILSTNKLTWSAQGGLQRDGRFIYAFDAEDQLVSVTSSVLSNGAIRVVNAYDYRHRRIAKTVYTMRDDSPPTSPLVPPSPIAYRTWCLKERHDFVYDDWNLIHETVTTVDANSSTNIAEIEYFWGPDLSNTLQGAGGVGGLLAVSRNGQFYFPVYDNLGNIVKYLDENGNIVASYTYDDFGRMLSSSGSVFDLFSFRFSTKYFDSEIGLYYYCNRFYHPILVRWLNRDPIEEDGGLNLYMACMNNAMTFFDILGLAAYRDLAAKYPLRSAYPTDITMANNIWQLIGGKVLLNAQIGKFNNSCAVRLSHALNKSGDMIPYIKGQTSSGKAMTKGKIVAKWWYIFRVKQMKTYLSQRYGKPTIYKTREDFEKCAQQGILVLEVTGWNDASGHVTLWDGKKTIDGSEEYFDKPNAIFNHWRMK